MTPSILILNTYSHINPISGGQRRVAAIVDKYRELGLKVYYVGIYSHTSVSPDMNTKGPYDVLIRSQESLDKIDSAHREYTGDLAIGRITVEDEEVYQALIRRIQKYKPSFIELEHPFLLPFIYRAREEGYISHQTIIHSSHNVEAEMKRQMLEADPSIPEKRKREITKAVKEVEAGLCRLATYTIAVTEADAKTFRSLGAKKVIIAPNAIGQPIRSERSTSALREKYSKEGTKKTIVFVGSAHPPNMQGYLDVIGTRLGFLPYGRKLVITGTVSWMVEEYMRKASPLEQRVFELRTELTGRVTDTKLAAILDLADVIALPITTGGGSNLKTAEAIYSGKPVLGTEFAFRGFEDYASLPGITLVKTKEEFHKKMVELTNDDYKAPKRNAAQRRKASQVLWPNALQQLKEIVS